MRRLSLALSALLFVLAAGCSGGTPTTPSAGTSSAFGSAGTQVRSIDYGKPRVLSLFRTPPYPPRPTHKITAALRARARKAGWQPVVTVPSFTQGPSTELLMTDGSVLVADLCTPNWFKLTPDQNGNYTTGTWSKIAAMPSTYGPLYFASAVLADDKVIVQGGEYNFCKGAETTLGAIYDPVANSWSAVSGPSGWSQIGDAQSAVLSNGTYMLGNCCYKEQALLNEASMSWTIIGNGKQDTNSEEGWTLLPNGDVLETNVFDPPYAQVYNPTANAWQSAGQTPVSLVSSNDEIGPQTLRPDGTVFVAGANGYSAVYNSKTAAWTQGPTFPVEGGQQLAVGDGPSSLLTDGSVLIAASPVYYPPSYYFLFNGKKLKSITGPPNAPNDSSYAVRLLVLPTGQVLETDGSTDIEIYTPKTTGGARYAPHITSVPTTLTHGTTYQIQGRLFNGMSQANFYGDDDQQATNFPLVRVTNGSTGHVFYCRTHNHSFMGVASPSKVSTMFDVPKTIEKGSSSLVVVANGIASPAVSVTIK
ncbi:MAG: hypothetical protein JOZ77_00590 [Candidatus Eremiobacteraeota bacterium]|nr:hypothetical protein [Candidatus Eremiobacteraeota bacterium]